ncbi:sulfatase family protein [Niabella aquatica]
MIKKYYRLLLLTAVSFWGFAKSEAQQANTGKPNFIIILTDDQGYGDLSTYGNPTIHTPNIDRMAAEGQKWSNFYVAANVCTPSRAGLLTGRLPIRSGMAGTASHRVLFPGSKGGLPASELTIAELLKQNGYYTAHIGKWHLGSLSQYLPTRNGFDHYFGVPYSNDMDRVDSVPYLKAITEPKNEYFQVPLMRNETVIERPAVQNTLTERYTKEAVALIKKNKNHPFFLYLAHNMPHVPLFPNPKFKGKSQRGTYGDIIEEIDWSVGEILSALKENGVDKNTYVIFISDNGPWKLFKELGGSSGPLYGAKGNSYEGGVRIPAIFWGKGIVKPRFVTEIGSTLDILPTFLSLAGGKIPQDRIWDGYDLSNILNGKDDHSPRSEFYYYHADVLAAVRKGPYKLLFYSSNPVGYPADFRKLDTPELFNLNEDISESNNIASKYPETVKALELLAEKHLSTVEKVEDQLSK